ncbi:phosphoribosyltransferase family protein [Bacteroidota bacterium]
MRSEPIKLENQDIISVSSVSVPKRFVEDVSGVLISKGLIKDRIEAVAEEIAEDYKNNDLHLLCVLEGAKPFHYQVESVLSDVHSKNSGFKPFYSHEIKVESYKDTKSSGKIKITSAANLEELAGKDVLIVEDIVDTGKTLKGIKDMKEPQIGLIEHLETKYNPNSVRVLTLLDKRVSKVDNYKPDYTCFSIPKLFVVGYGMDINQHLREIPHLCVISDKGIQKYSISK